jgi:hypothetical protein
LCYSACELTAAQAYDKVAKEYGKPLNFPDPQNETQVQAVKFRSKKGMEDVTRRSKYTGVSWNKNNKKWLVQIGMNGKGVNFYSESEELAAKEYDKQAALLGRPVNFPENDAQVQAVKMKARPTVAKTLK